MKTDFNLNLAEEYTNYQKEYGIPPGRGFYTDYVKKGRFAVTAGGLWKPVPALVFYAGAGYGQRWTE